MSRQIAVQGADAYITNATGNNYLPVLQVTTGQRSKLHKVVTSNLGATDLYLWIFDLAAGAAGSVNPRIVELCPAGVCTTLDLPTGKPFVNGIYLALATAAPPDANTAPTAAANNAAILDADFRLE